MILLNITILENFLYILKGLFLTLLITSISLFIGLLLGFIVGILIYIKYKIFTINNSFLNKVPSFYSILDFYKRLLMNTPIITQLCIISYVIPFQLNSFLSGLIVLGLNSAAHVSDIVLSGFNNISELQWNTSVMLGYTPVGAIKKIFIKMVFKNNKKLLFNEFIQLLKESSVLSFFGIREIVSRSREVSFQTYNFVPYMLFVSALYFTIITISKYIYDKFFDKD